MLPRFSPAGRVDASPSSGDVRGRSLGVSPRDRPLFPFPNFADTAQRETRTVVLSERQCHRSLGVPGGPSVGGDCLVVDYGEFQLPFLGKFRWRFWGFSLVVFGDFQIVFFGEFQLPLTIRTGAAPRIMASLRNAVLGVLALKDQRREPCGRTRDRRP